MKIGQIIYLAVVFFSCGEFEKRPRLAHGLGKDMEVVPAGSGDTNPRPRVVSARAKGLAPTYRKIECELGGFHVQKYTSQTGN
jgi:hypothetical protein